MLFFNNINFKFGADLIFLINLIIFEWNVFIFNNFFMISKVIYMCVAQSSENREK